MIDLDSILVVDPSRLMREVLAKVMSPHARHVRVASTGAIARECLAGSMAPTMVLCALELPDDDGLALLSAFEDRAPQTCFVLLASKWSAEQRERAEAGGAAGLLSKPVSIHDITRVWSDFRRAIQVRDERVRPRARVQVVESDGERLVSWRIRDLSVSGAFIETRGPLPVGQQLSLEIVSGGRRIPLEAEVVRVQEPSWLSPAGVAVGFLEVGSRASLDLEELIAQVRRVELWIGAMLEVA